MMRYSRRHVIKQGALLSVASAAVACGDTAVPGNSSAAATAASTPSQTPATPFALRITIHGAYGLIKRRGGGLTVANLAHPAADANPCNYDYSKHEMLLILRAGSIDAGKTTHAQTVNGKITYWKLSGAVTPKSGSGGVDLPSASTLKDEFEPYAPSNPANDWAWNDLNYVPSLGKVGPNWLSRAAATFELPAGTLRVLAPPNAYGRIGRWKWPGTTKRSRAISDMVVLESEAAGSLTLTSPQGDIALLPQSGQLSIEIVSELVPVEQVIKAGEPLGHLAMLYDFVDPSLSCASRPVPVYDPIPGRPEPDKDHLTPGVECPLAIFEE